MLGDWFVYSVLMSKVVLYELNEVPWEIIDLYVAKRPQSHLAGLLPLSRCETTRNDDPHHLSPWCTWPTFHTGLYSAEHKSYDLGQDPDTFQGINIWDVAERSGRSVGLFGVLQSWPPREFAHGGFYVPDTFARTPATVPPALERFQEFNLSMTNELGFSADAALKPGRLVGAGLDMVRKGLSPWSMRRLAKQLLRERKDARYKAGRSIMQAVPAFDLYWRMHRRVRPDLSIFFTNHVAGMLHRFWGDAVPGYAEKFAYEVDEIFAGFVVEAMDVFDHQLGHILKFIEDDGDSVLIIAASMGQGGIPYDHIAETYVVEDADQLAATLQLGPTEKGLAMYPMNALEFPDGAAAERAGRVLDLVVSGGKPLLHDVRVDGRSISYRVRQEIDGDDLSHEVEYRTAVGGPVQTGKIEDLGIGTAKRLGGGNTAYHMPQGIYITHGPGVTADDSRREFDVRSAAEVVLGHMGLAEAWSDARTTG